jgi:hypothetical protein
MFGNWLNGVAKKDKGHIRVGVCALLWVVWTVRNDVIFNGKCFPSFMQIIPLATYWIHMWSYLQPEDVRKDMEWVQPFGDGSLGFIGVLRGDSHEDLVAPSALVHFSLACFCRDFK